MIPYADRTFVASLCRGWAGLSTDPAKAYWMESRLAPLARREGFESPAAVIDALRRGGDARLGWATVEAMAAPGPAFFHDRPVLERVVGEILPALACARGAEPIRVWIAGCGVGQEVYSLAMLLAQSPTLAARVELCATDLSARNIERAQAGVFSQFEVQQGLPARMLVGFFDNRGGEFEISQRLRTMVTWRRVNLAEGQIGMGPFDLVLCRTSLAQLTDEGRAAAMTNLRHALARHGRLITNGNDTRDDGQAAVDRASRVAA
jgi:chemotaxis protein methyltransferase CheR